MNKTKKQNFIKNAFPFIETSPTFFYIYLTLFHGLCDYSFPFFRRSPLDITEIHFVSTLFTHQDTQSFNENPASRAKRTLRFSYT